GELVVGRADRALAAVDEVEPVAPARGSPAGEAADRLHEAAAVACLDVEARAQQPHHGLPVADLANADVADGSPPEVAGHEQLHSTRPLLARPEAAASGRQAGDEQQQGGR